MLPNVLLLCAERPDRSALGGVQVHTATLAALGRRHARIWTAHVDAQSLRVESWALRRALVASIPFEGAPARVAAIQAAIVGTGVDVVHVHSPQIDPTAIADALETCDAHLVLTLHDHATICQNHQLLELGRQYCGIPRSLARCDRCLKATRSQPPGALTAWREQMRRLTDRASSVITPSASVLDHARRVHPIAEERVARIPWGVTPSGRVPATARTDGTLRIGVIGLWEGAKGRDRMRALLEACDDLDVEWHFFGATGGASQRGLRARTRRVTLHGAYRREELSRRLVAAECDIAVLPSIVPEAFSLTLSEVWSAGVPALVSHLGALGERVAPSRFGWTFDPWSPADLRARIGALIAAPHLVTEAREAVRRHSHRTDVAMVDDHVALWTRLCQERRAPTLEPNTAGARQLFVANRTVEPGPVGRFARSMIRSIGRTNGYRDLALRRVLPEITRKRVAEVVSRVANRRRKR